MGTRNPGNRIRPKYPDIFESDLNLKVYYLGTSCIRPEYKRNLICI
jgi:hypothetical protein